MKPVGCNTHVVGNVAINPVGRTGGLKRSKRRPVARTSYRALAPNSVLATAMHSVKLAQVRSSVDTKGVPRDELVLVKSRRFSKSTSQRYMENGLRILCKQVQ